MVWIICNPCRVKKVKFETTTEEVKVANVTIPNTLSTDLSGKYAITRIAVLISLVVAIWFKDFATGLAKGLKFKYDPSF